MISGGCCANSAILEHVLRRVAREVRDEFVVDRQVGREHEEVVDAVGQMQVGDEGPIRRVLPTPVASAKHSDGNSRSKSSSVLNSAFSVERIAGTSRSWPKSSGAASSARTNLMSESAWGSRRDRRPVTACRTRLFIIRSPKQTALIQIRSSHFSTLGLLVGGLGGCRRFHRIGFGHRQVRHIQAVIVMPHSQRASTIFGIFFSVRFGQRSLALAAVTPWKAAQQTSKLRSEPTSSDSACNCSADRFCVVT